MADTLKKVAIGLLIGLIIGGLAYLYLQHQINDAYKRGLAQCAKDTDTLIVRTPPIIKYRDTSYTAQTPVTQTQNDSVFSFETKFDTTAVFDQDSIQTHSTAIITLNIKSKKVDKFAKWVQKINYRKFEQQPDTVKIYTPKYITTVEKQTNWLYILVGIVVAFFTGKFL